MANFMGHGSAGPPYGEAYKWTHYTLLRNVVRSLRDKGQEQGQDQGQGEAPAVMLASASAGMDAGAVGARTAPANRP